MSSLKKTRTGLLIILDGFGINPKKEFNAVKLAQTPTLDRLYQKYSSTEIQGSVEHYLGYRMRNGTILVHGDAGHAVGEESKAGTITITGTYQSRGEKYKAKINGTKK